MSTSEPTPRLFEPLSLREVRLPNRIVVSPMCMYSAVDGTASSWHHVHLGSLAASGAGLVLAEATAVEARGRITPECLGLWNDDHARALARVVATVREVAPRSVLGIQLAHAGRKASHARPWSSPRGYVPPDAGGWSSVGASADSYENIAPPADALDQEGLDTVRTAFADAARRAASIGFDVVEMHAAHGYLLSSFLSPLSNHRTDAYGGSLENRMRYPLEVFDAMRAAMPAEVPLLVRFSGTDWRDDLGGWSTEDSVAFARELEARGCDGVDVSTGGNAKAEIPAGPGFQVPFAAAVKRGVESMPVIAVGELDDPKLAEEVLERGDADAIAIGRGMLRNPRWAWDAAETLGGRADYVDQYAWCVGKG
ncbi:NADH:flavin oxidoreductase/NADH oxidase [Phycisphaerales bacterium]|nr:NADH:flavin oxidoreductase/NADH oxidase [Phycisphaerales bacterium]RPG14938.1 MAG: NADH:flavin oxidoreductase/NADH oxidase [Phycisphaera sp. TMED9]